MSRVWWCTSIISVRRLRQEDHELEVSLGYIVKLSPNPSHHKKESK
jgi:hypothetical protein